jgi:hypothetical protein
MLNQSRTLTQEPSSTQLRESFGPSAPGKSEQLSQSTVRLSSRHETLGPPTENPMPPDGQRAAVVGGGSDVRKSYDEI